MDRVIVNYCCMAAVIVLGCMLQGCEKESSEALQVPSQATPSPTLFLSPTLETPDTTTTTTPVPTPAPARNPTKAPTVAPTPSSAPEVSDFGCQDAGFLHFGWACEDNPDDLCYCQTFVDFGWCTASFSHAITVQERCKRSCGLCGEGGPNPTPSSPSPSPSPSPTPPSPTPPSDSNAKVSDRAWEHFKLLNELRAEGFTCPQGASFAKNDVPLEFDCRLWKASQLHSQDMADQAYFAHQSQDGRSPWDRAEAQGISANGENIAAGNSDAAAVLEQWKNSDGHCRNMGNPDFKLFAVGYGFNAKSPYRHYWTQMFKRAEVELDTSCYPAEAKSTIMMAKNTNMMAKTSVVAKASVEANSTPAPSPEAGEIVGQPWTTIDIEPLHDQP